MGLAASQGRYLCLTARNNDLIYEGQQIAQQRLALTDLAQEVADKYNEKMNNKKLEATVLIGGSEVTQQLTYDLLTSSDPYSGLGMRIVDLNGNVVVPGEYLEISKNELNKEKESTRVYSAEEFIKKYLTDEDETAITTFRNSLPDLMNYYNETYSSSTNLTVSLMNKSTAYNGLLNYNFDENGNIAPTEGITIDENCLKPEYLQEMLTSGQWLIQKQNSDEKPTDFHNMVWQGSNRITEVYDTSDDAAAEAEYESEMQAVQKRDKVLELRLQAVETEQSAVQKELESIKQVIDKNIEDSFKTFA